MCAICPIQDEKNAYGNAMPTNSIFEFPRIVTALAFEFVNSFSRTAAELKMKAAEIEGDAAHEFHGLGDILLNIADQSEAVALKFCGGTTGEVSTRLHFEKFERRPSSVVNLGALYDCAGTPACEDPEQRAVDAQLFLRLLDRLFFNREKVKSQFMIYIDEKDLVYAAAGAKTRQEKRCATIKANDASAKARGQLTSREKRTATIKANDASAKASGQLTSTEKWAATVKANDASAKASGQLTSKEKAAATVKANDASAKASGQLTSKEKRAATVKANDAKAKASGQLTSIGKRKPALWEVVALWEFTGTDGEFRERAVPLNELAAKKANTAMSLNERAPYIDHGLQQKLQMERKRAAELDAEATAGPSKKAKM